MQFGGCNKQRREMYFSMVTKENVMVGVSIREAARPSPEWELNAGIRLGCWGRAMEDFWEALALLQLLGGENSGTDNSRP